MHIEILKKYKIIFFSNFRQNHSPSLRLALGDKLFLHHLKLLVEQPSKKHLNQLQNRFLTLRSRRTDEVSSRFFLRDWAVNPPPSPTHKQNDHGLNMTKKTISNQQKYYPILCYENVEKKKAMTTRNLKYGSQIKHNHTTLAGFL